MAVTKKTVDEEPVVSDFVDPDAYVWLLYTEATPKVVQPYGELKTGEVVAAQKEKLDSLMATGLFEKYSGATPDAVRHP